MKKRSLVAAIAMLIVSAIVLTSSTYAWFASNGAATVGAMNANVANNDGTLQVKATTSAVAGSDWKTALTSADYNGYTTALTPVSMYMNNGAPSFYKASYDGVKFTAGSNGTVSDYLKYGFDVRYDNGSESAATISMTPTWSDTSDFVYALVEVVAGGNTTYYMFSSGSYTPLTSISGDSEVQDTKGTGAAVDVIDAADTGYANAVMGNTDGTTPGTSGTAIEIAAAASASTTANVNVYIWAEGQDPQCSGITAAGAGSMSFNISVA